MRKYAENESVSFSGGYTDLCWSKGKDGWVISTVPGASTVSGIFPSALQVWGNRKRIRVNHFSPSTPAHIKLFYTSGEDTGSTIYLSSLAQTDFDDVRFTADDTSAAEDYWIYDKTDSNSAHLYVELPDDSTGRTYSVTESSIVNIFPSNLSSFSRRKRFVIANHYASAALRLHILYSAGTDADSDVYLSNVAQTDFDDIRFARGDTSTLINQWKEDHNTGHSAIYYVELPGAGGIDSTLYMYYGSTGGPSSSDISSVMLISDDCEGTDPYSKWVSTTDGTNNLSYTTDQHKFGTKSLKFEFSGGTNDIDISSGESVAHWRQVVWQYIDDYNPLRRTYFWLRGTHSIAATVTHNVAAGKSTGELNWFDGTWHSTNYHAQSNAWNGFMFDAKSSNNVVNWYFWSANKWKEIATSIARETNFGKSRGLRVRTTGTSGVTYLDNVYAYRTNTTHPTVSNAFHSAVPSTGDSTISGHSIAYHDMYIYYNNATATQGSDPSAVTLWVDDCEGTDPYSKWKINGSYANISAFYSSGIAKHMNKGLKLEMSTGAGNTLIISTATRAGHFKNTLWFYTPQIKHTIDLLHYGSVGASGPNYQVRLSAGLIKVYSASAYTTTGRNYDSATWLGMQFDMNSSGTAQKLYVYSANAWTNYSNANLTQGIPHSHRFLIQPTTGTSGIVYFDTIYGRYASSTQPIVSGTHSTVSSGYQDSTVQRMSGAYSSLVQNPTGLSSLVYYYAKIGDIDAQSVTFKLYDSGGGSMVANGSHNYLEDLRTVTPQPFYFKVYMKQLSATKSSPIFREWEYGYTKSAPTIEQHKSVTLGGSTVNVIMPRQYNLMKNTITIPLINASAPAIQEFGGPFWQFDNIEFTSYKSAIIDSIVKAAQRGSHLQINYGGIDDEKQTYSIAFTRITKTKVGGEQYYKASGEGVII